MCITQLYAIQDCSLWFLGNICSKGGKKLGTSHKRAGLEIDCPSIMIPVKIFLLEVTGCSHSKFSLNVKPNVPAQQVLSLSRVSPLAKHRRYSHSGIALHGKILQHGSEAKQRSHFCLTALGLQESGFSIASILWKPQCTSNDRWPPTRFPG